MAVTVVRYAQVVTAYPDRGLVVVWRDGAVIRRRRLQAREDPRGDAYTDWVAVRAEAARVAGRPVLIPRLGEKVPPEHNFAHGACTYCGADSRHYKGCVTQR